MNISLPKFALMLDAANALYEHRILSDYNDKEQLILSCQRVVYILFNYNMENDMAECTSEEMAIVSKYYEKQEGCFAL